MGGSGDSVILVARPELTPALRQRLGFDTSVLVFSACESAHALEVVAQRRSQCVAMDRQFANSAAGAEFLAALRRSPSVSEVRILLDEGTEIPLVLKRPVVGTGRVTLASASHVLPRLENRRLPRFPVRSGLEALVNGNRADLVDVSLAGAQMLSLNVLRPLQQVRISLPTDVAAIRVRGGIAWSTFERADGNGMTRYRVGVEFYDADRDALSVFCVNNRLPAAAY